MAQTAEIIEGNKLIAEFMGHKVSYGLENAMLISTQEITYTPAKYHTSWDWLMPVWYKIRDLRFDEPKLQLEHMKVKTPITHFICYGTIEHAFIEILAAITWYNTTKTN
jgi:hypothetical protein